MIVLGITGSIGMGKSTLAAMCADMGLPVHNSDEAAHAALSPGGGAFEEVAVTFPEAWNAKNHTIDRQILGGLVFADTDKRRALEAIIHPAVWDSQHKFLMTQRRMGRKIAALDIPLLYETGAQERVDYVIVASAPPDIQKRRVMTRPNMNEEKFAAILATQMSDAEKRARADYIVETGLGLAHSRRSLTKIIASLRCPQSR